MKLFFKEKGTSLLDKEDLSERLQNCQERKEFFLITIKTLLFFIRNFSLVDLEEKKTIEFNKDIDDLTDTFLTQKKTKDIQSIFEKRKKTIFSFIKQQKNYLLERENELKEIIDILTEATAALNTRNQDFNLTFHKHNEKVEKLTLLDDIKKIKSALIQEVAYMREAIKEKQLEDNKQMQMLSKQIDSLKTQLKKAENKSLIDGLTGIYNRKAFDLHIRNLIEQNSVTKTAFSMLFLDIDDFKQINDTYGHQVGDRVIFALVNRCKNSIREGDFLCRYGGEEFIIILLGASLKVATMRAKQICRSIAKTRYSFTERGKKQALFFTVSIGVSSYKKGDTLTSIIKRSDKALYAAKYSGKNRVIIEKK